jgi:uncharacterized protein (TIGR00369 family)
MTEQEPDEIPGETLEPLRTYVETEHGFLSWLGFTVGTFEPGRMVATVPFDGKPTNPTDPPTVHGGVASTLIDTVGGLVFRPYLEDPIAGDIATINLNLNYLRRATGDLTATGGSSAPAKASGSPPLRSKARRPTAGNDPSPSDRVPTGCFRGELK